MMATRQFGRHRFIWQAPRVWGSVLLLAASLLTVAGAGTPSAGGASTWTAQQVIPIPSNAGAISETADGTFWAAGNGQMDKILCPSTGQCAVQSFPISGTFYVTGSMPDRSDRLWSISGSSGNGILSYLDSGACTSTSCAVTTTSHPLGYAAFGGVLSPTSDLFVASGYQGEIVAVIPGGCVVNSCIRNVDISHVGGGNTVSGLAAGGDGNLWVAVSGNLLDAGGFAPVFGAVAEFDPATGELLHSFGSYDNPAGLAIDGRGNVFFSEQGQRLVGANSGASVGTKLHEIPAGCFTSDCVLSLSGFSSPGSLAFDPMGNLWVADLGRSVLQEIPASCVAVITSCGTLPPALPASGMGGVETKVSSDRSGGLWVSNDSSAQQFTYAGGQVPPTNVRAGGISSNTATVSWQAAPGALRYKVVATANGSSVSCTTTTRSCNLTGLAPATTYTITVAAAASSSGSFGPRSMAIQLATRTATTARAPGAPSSAGVVRDLRGLTATWTAPSVRASKVLGYVAVASPGGSTCFAPAGATSCWLSTLSSSTKYTVTVRAVGAGGTSAVTTAAVPVKPRGS